MIILLWVMALAYNIRNRHVIELETLIAKQTNSRQAISIK